MIEKSRIEEADRNVSRYIADGLLKTQNEEVKEFIGFFMSNADSSLETASLLFQVSDDANAKDQLRMRRDFESYLWVIVSSYYSMFYAATALLASQGIKAKGDVVHKVTADALIHFFISNKRLAKLMAEYEEAKDVSLELIGREELLKRIDSRANELILGFDRERRKRSRFQYDVGVVVKRAFAETSLNRAREFLFEIRKVMGSIRER